MKIEVGCTIDAPVAELPMGCEWRGTVDGVGQPVQLSVWRDGAVIGHLHVIAGHGWSVCGDTTIHWESCGLMETSRRLVRALGLEVQP
jgi:hypothetical protein